MDITTDTNSNNNTKASNEIKKLLFGFEDLFEGMGISQYGEDDQSIESIDVTFGITDSINLARSKKENKKPISSKNGKRRDNNEEEGARPMEEGGNKMQRLSHGRRRSGVRRGSNTSSDTTSVVMIKNE